MQRTKPENLDRPKHADIQRESMEDIRERQASPGPGEIRYRDPNRDRALGEADRTGRHFDEDVKDMENPSEALEDHEAD
jgi:hypothetical protein